MTVALNSILKLVAAALVVISTIGVISAAQHYFALSVINDALRSKQTLDESFVLMIKSGLATSQGDGSLRKSVEDESRQLNAVHHSITELTSQVQRRQLIDISLWVLVFIAAMIALVKAQRSTRQIPASPSGR